MSKILFYVNLKETTLEQCHSFVQKALAKGYKWYRKNNEFIFGTNLGIWVYDDYEMISTDILPMLKQGGSMVS